MTGPNVSLTKKGEAYAAEHEQGGAVADRPAHPHAFDPMALEIVPGLKVGDLKSEDDCARAVVQVDMQIEAILAQISKAEADPSSGLNRPGWRSKAQGAIRWKKRIRQAVHRVAAQFRRTRLKDGFQWQPIDGAPRDGRFIWGWLNDRGIVALRWAEDPDEVLNPAWVEVADEDEVWEPRWWLPYDAFPLPPASAAAAIAAGRGRP